MKTTYANGDVYSASDVNDTNGTINLLGASVAYAAGKNDILNSDFSIWQRGTSFTNPVNDSYQADRWSVVADGTGATKTVSQQTFTPGTAPVAGYEGRFFYRFAQSVAGTLATYNVVRQKIEDVRTFANQTVTFSFWAKSDAARTISVNFAQNFGSGGSSQVDLGSTSINTTTSWVRYTTTHTIPSISGKTIGTSSWLSANFNLPINSTFTIDIWGVQVESGSTAKAFQTATGTIQGELAACQRYFYNGGNTIGSMNTSGNALFIQNLPVHMRTTPSMSFTGTATVIVPFVSLTSDAE